MIGKLQTIEQEVLNTFPNVLCTCVGIDTLEFLRFRLNEQQFVITISPACQLQISAYGVDECNIKTAKPFFYGKINEKAALERMITEIREMLE